jgi:integrase
VLPLSDSSKAARGGRLEPLIVLMLGTRLRRGEALALHWSDVDLAAGHVRVRWTLGRVDKALVFDEPKTEALANSCHSSPLLPRR